MTRVIMVTGASAGFGEAIARKFTLAGWSAVLVARREKRLHDLRTELGRDKTHAVVLDVRHRGSVLQAIGDLPADWNKIDCLVNNAGLALGLEPAWESELDDWDTMVDTNIKGLTYLTRAVLPGMVDRGRGHIINIGSIAGSWPYPGSNVYGATKAFVEQFSNNLRADLHGRGIRVTNIEPGLAETEFSVVRFKGDAQKAGSVYTGTQPLLAEDVAESVYFAANAPAHVNINRIELMPTTQSFGPLQVSRSPMK